MSEPDYIRVCPVCGAQHPPSAARCACGSFLAGADLSLRAPTVPLLTEDIAVVPAPVQPAFPCPHADCGGLNQPDAQRCIYCDRPLRAEAAGPRAFLDWPWGGALEVRGSVVIGRHEPLPEDLVAELTLRFDNVSRRHAELGFVDGVLWIVDLDSKNGTFVDGVRLASGRRTTLDAGSKVRFAADLAATVRIVP